jgi:hypothetical protein
VIDDDRRDADPDALLSNRRRDVTFLDSATTTSYRRP